MLYPDLQDPSPYRLVLTWVLWALSNATFTLQLFEQNGRRIDATVVCCLANLVMNLVVLVLVRRAQHGTRLDLVAARKRSASRRGLLRHPGRLVAMVFLPALFVEDAGADERSPTPFSIYSQVAPRMMRVVARDDGGRVGLGSAVPVAPSIAVTNCHVTRRATSVVLAPAFDALPMHYEVVAQAADPDRDLCLLRTATPMTAQPFTLGRPRVGEPVLAVGFSGGLSLRMHPGEITWLYPFDGAEVIRSSTAFGSGASGGGLFNTRGELVGILTFRARAGEGQFYSLPVDWIADVAARRPFDSVAPMPAGLAFWERAATERPMFLRANELEALEQWSELVTLAQQWITRDPADANAWLMLGRALLHTDRLAEAITAFQVSVATNRSFAPAWFELGVAHLRSGDDDGAEHVHERLVQLDRDMARSLRERTGVGARRPATD